MSKIQNCLKNSYPKFSPIAVSKEGVLIYSMDKMRYWLYRSNDIGASATFLNNNAAINTRTQYALKVFWEEKEARNSYRRQKLAAKVGLAPPVGRFFVVVTKKGNIVRWGYQTCRADISDITNVAKVCDALRISLKKIVAPSDDLPSAYATKKPCVLGGDLHEDNIGVWEGRYVCIDFGHHSLVQSNGRRLNTNKKFGSFNNFWSR